MRAVLFVVAAVSSASSAKVEEATPPLEQCTTPLKCAEGCVCRRQSNYQSCFRTPVSSKHEILCDSEAEEAPAEEVATPCPLHCMPGAMCINHEDGKLVPPRCVPIELEAAPTPPPLEKCITPLKCAKGCVCRRQSNYQSCFRTPVSLKHEFLCDSEAEEAPAEPASSAWHCHGPAWLCSGLNQTKCVSMGYACDWAPSVATPLIV